MKIQISFENRDRLLELGFTIGLLRKMKGMTQEELSEKAGLSRTHISNIEAPNTVTNFSIDSLYRIADALDMRAGDLLNAPFPGGKS